MAMTTERAREIAAAQETALDRLFWDCVAAVARFGEATGLGYEAANILLFVVLHPLLTLALGAALAAALMERRRLRRRLAAAEARASPPADTAPAPPRI